MSNPIFQDTDPATLPPGFTPRTVSRSGVDTQIVCLDLNPGGAEALMDPAVGFPVNVIAGNMTIQAGTTALPVGMATDAIFSGVTALTPKFAPISAASSGDNTVVAAVTSKKIRVLKYTVVSTGTVTAKFKTAAGADLTGAMPMVANSGIGGAYCPVGMFETASGAALVLNLSAAVAVAGHVTYVEV